MGKRAASSIHRAKAQIKKTHQSYSYSIVQAEFTDIQTQVNLLWEGHYIKYKMGYQN